MVITREEKIQLSLQAADDIKAEDPVALNVQNLSAVTDCYIIVSGNSDTQVGAIADNIVETLSEKGVEPIGTEGYNEKTWILLDYDDVVIHVFHRDKRVYYALENLWSDAPRVKVPDLEKIAEAGQIVTPKRSAT